MTPIHKGDAIGIYIYLYIMCGNYKGELKNAGWCYSTKHTQLKVTVMWSA